MNTSFAFSAQNLEKIQKILVQYPANRQASAVLPLLDLAQRQNEGWLSQAALETVANMLNMPSIRVYEVASFYTMFNLKPVGKYHLQVCRTTPCWLRGSDEILKKCSEVTQVSPGQPSEDSLFSITEVECLGACINAPVVQINDDYVEDVDADQIEALLKALQQGQSLPVLLKKAIEGKNNA